MSNHMNIKLLLIAFAVVLSPYNSAQAAQKFTRSQAYGDWALNCSKNNNPKVKVTEKCVLQQKLLAQNGQTLVVIRILKIDNRAEKLAMFALPLGLNIPEGAKITIDKGNPRRLLITHCIKGGCMAQISLDKRLSRELSKGKKMKISVFTGDGRKKMEFPSSLKGLTSGLKATK